MHPQPRAVHPIAAEVHRAACSPQGNEGVHRGSFGQTCLPKTLDQLLRYLWGSRSYGLLWTSFVLRGNAEQSSHTFNQRVTMERLLEVSGGSKLFGKLLARIRRQHRERNAPLREHFHYSRRSAVCKSHIQHRSLAAVNLDHSDCCFSARSKPRDCKTSP